MLGLKKKITEEQWKYAWEHCESMFPLEHIKKREEEAIERILYHRNSYKKIAFGYTAGKDSIALAEIVKRSGIEAQSIRWITPLQFPEVEEWIKKHKPMDTKTVVMNYGNYDFLNKHPEYLFSQQGSIKGWLRRKWTEQKRYLKDNNYDLFITGRRTLDHNVCGNKKSNFIKTSKLYDTLTPIADWKHEEVFAYIKYRDLGLPPNYFWKRGFLIGSGAWAERDAFDLSEEEVWDEIYEIDKSVVINSAPHLDSAKRYLERRGRRNGNN